MQSNIELQISTYNFMENLLFSMILIDETKIAFNETYWMFM